METVSAYKRGRDRVQATDWVFAILLGIVGALVGGWLAAALFNTHPIDGALDVSSIVVATIGAIIVVVVVGMFSGRRTGRRSIF